MLKKLIHMFHSFQSNRSARLNLAHQRIAKYDGLCFRRARMPSGGQTIQRRLFPFTYRSTKSIP